MIKFLFDSSNFHFHLDLEHCPSHRVQQLPRARGGGCVDCVGVHCMYEISVKCSFVEDLAAMLDGRNNMIPL